MILVTIGNATQGFRRLLDAVDALAGEGLFGGEEVLIQFGNTSNFRALNCTQEAFLQGDRFIETIHAASLVISHAGAGTLLNALRVGHTPVVMPRRRQHGEHVDDHQVELVEAMAADGRVIAAYEPDDLPAAIEQARRQKVRTSPASTSQMIALVNQAISDLSQRKARN